ncbi:hypothetical protein TL16_g02572, partial [Triparma laevis f. inornata]
LLTPRRQPTFLHLKQPPSTPLPPPPPAITFFSAVGALDTLYLTLQKAVPQSTAIQSISKLCPPSMGDCANTVLSSPFSTLTIGSISLPLSLFGFVTYLFVLTQTLSPNPNPTLLKITFQVLTLISLSLSLLLTFYFRVPCTFCIISILSSLISSYYGLTWLNTSTTTSKTLPMSMLTFIMSGLLVFASEKPSVTNALPGLGEESITAGKVVDKETRYTPPKITEVTSKESLNLLKRLKTLNAKSYGAYWCSHCFDQKQMLGSKFYDFVEYKECASDGVGWTKEGCLIDGKKLKGYPTWVIGGQKIEGERYFNELLEIVDNIEKGLPAESD